MIKITWFYEPEADNNAILHVRKHEDLILGVLKNSEELNSEYDERLYDILMVHCMTNYNWFAENFELLYGSD